MDFESFLDSSLSKSLRNHIENRIFSDIDLMGYKKTFIKEIDFVEDSIYEILWNVYEVLKDESENLKNSIEEYLDGYEEQLEEE